MPSQQLCCFDLATRRVIESAEMVTPWIDGRGGRRRMRGRLDVVERDGVQRQGAAMVGWKKKMKQNNEPYSIS